MPITNFFAHIAAIPFEGCLNITIRKDGEQLIISVLLQNDGCGDAAKNHIPPLILKGSTKELCEGFFDAVTTPLAETSQLLVNMEQYLKGQEAARQHAAIEKKKTEKVDKGATTDKTATPTTPEQVQEMKYNGIMAKVDALEKEGKFRDAWRKVPEPAEFPEKADKIRKRRASLSAKFDPDLFGATPPETEEKNVEPNTDYDATDNTDAEGFPDERQGE
jgi:PRTRC genetic system protein E